jgi:hypothetical protein
VTDVDPHLSQPATCAVHLGTSVEIAPHQRFLLQGSTKYFSDLLWLQLKGSPNAYGSFDSAGHPSSSRFPAASSCSSSSRFDAIAFALATEETA